METADPAALQALEARAEDVARRLALMANPKRLLILCFLANGEATVGAIQNAVGIGQSSLSQHLAKLRKGGVLKTRRESQSIYYTLADEQTIALMASLYETFCGAE